jgi:uncharacterized membrane protein
MMPININLSNIEFAQDTCKMMAGGLFGELLLLNILTKIFFPIIIMFILWRLFDYMKFVRLHPTRRN